MLVACRYKIKIISRFMNGQEDEEKPDTVDDVRQFSVEVTQTHIGITRGLLTLSGALILVFIGLRYACWEYSFSKWITNVTVPLLALVSMWMCVFLTGMVVSAYYRIVKEVASKDLSNQALILSGGALVYLGLLLGLVLSVRYSPETHLPHLLILVKLTTMHIAFAVKFRSDWHAVALHLIVAGWYLGSGLFIYFMDWTDSLINLSLVSSVCIAFVGLIVVAMRSWPLAAGIFILSGSFLSSVNDWRILTTVMAILGSIGSIFSSKEMLVDVTSRAVARIAGSFNPVVPDGQTENQPLLKSS